MRNELVETFAKRREELLEELDKKNTPIEKKHQIYGAINELDMFLNTMDYIKNTNELDTKNINLVKPNPSEKTIVDKVLENLKQKIKRN